MTYAEKKWTMYTIFRRGGGGVPRLAPAISCNFSMSFAFFRQKGSFTGGGEGPFCGVANIGAGGL